MQRDSLANTIFIAVAVCLVCSFLVSAAAVGLKPLQDANVALDKKKNILLAAGISEDEIKKGDIEEIFKARVNTVVLNIATGESGEAVHEEFLEAIGDKEIVDIESALEKYDPIATADKQAEASAKKLETDPASLKWRENFTFVYEVKGDADQVEKYVFPMRGRGLWSTMKGFVALETDFNTVAGLTYYEHGETPGLGGEIDNPNWKKLWPGKKLFDGDEVKLKVIKGQATDEYSVDGLSGATITSNGVTNMIVFWFGSEGYQAFIEKQKK